MCSGKLTSQLQHATSPLNHVTLCIPWQLRVHCASVLGTPILGDLKYGKWAHKWLVPDAASASAAAATADAVVDADVSTATESGTASAMKSKRHSLVVVGGAEGGQAEGGGEGDLGLEKYPDRVRESIAEISGDGPLVNELLREEEIPCDAEERQKLKAAFSSATVPVSRAGAAQSVSGGAEGLAASTKADGDLLWRRAGVSQRLRESLLSDKYTGRVAEHRVMLLHSWKLAFPKLRLGARQAKKKSRDDRSSRQQRLGKRGMEEEAQRWREGLSGKPKIITVTAELPSHFRSVCAILSLPLPVV